MGVAASISSTKISLLSWYTDGVEKGIADIRISFVVPVAP
jgi:hypothetical protein